MAPRFLYNQRRDDVQLRPAVARRVESAPSRSACGLCPCRGVHAARPSRHRLPPEVDHALFDLRRWILRRVAVTHRPLVRDWPGRRRHSVRHRFCSPRRHRHTVLLGSFPSSRVEPTHRSHWGFSRAFAETPLLVSSSRSRRLSCTTRRRFSSRPCGGVRGRADSDCCWSCCGADVIRLPRILSPCLLPRPTRSSFGKK